MQQRLFAVGLVFGLVLVGLPGAALSAQDGEAVTWPTTEWRVSPPEAQGVDSQILIRLMTLIADSETDIDSLLITRHGYIVLEAYWPPYNAQTRHQLASVAKSVVSALVGIAVQQGAITSVDQPVFDFFPLPTNAAPDDPRLAITLEDLLTMRAGLRCHDETDTTVEAMQRTTDWAAFMLRQPLDTPPGRQFNYCNGVSHVLSVLVGRATGQPTMDFAREHLFEPLGITRVVWARDPDGVPAGGWGLALTPRDMARFGYLYLRDGVWDGVQILSPEWVEASTTPHTFAMQAGQGYGYQWWVNSTRSFEAVGAGGQYIFVRRAKDMVVVMTSDTQVSNYEALVELLQEYVLYAARSDAPLPANPEAVAELEALVAAAADG